MLYQLGLSCGATSLALEALGVSLCKSRIYDALQETAKAPTMPRSVPSAGGSKSAIAPCVETSVPENAVRVSRLLAWCGNFLNAENGANLAGLLQ
jgi:hypothetical protein